MFMKSIKSSVIIYDWIVHLCCNNVSATLFDSHSFLFFSSLVGIHCVVVIVDRKSECCQVIVHASTHVLFPHNAPACYPACITMHTFIFFCYLLYFYAQFILLLFILAKVILFKKINKKKELEKLEPYTSFWPMITLLGLVQNTHLII